ncbi:MAG: D-alanyl-D-alanine carboxypeptidase family protein [Candidatus Altimarinota bacterium]
MLSSILSILGYGSLLNPLPEQQINEPYSLSVSAYPEKQAFQLMPVIKAKAVLSIDMDTGNLLYSQNSQAKLPMASLTKLMTILIVLEENSLDEIVTVTPEAVKMEPAKMYLVNNEKISVESLLKASLIPSANDAAVALAIHNAGSTGKFVEKMNKKAQELGMHDTKYANPMGFDDPEQYGTAEDLLILARKVYQQPFVKQYAAVKETEVSNTDQTLTHQLLNTNQLFDSYLQVFGLKTGTTDLAGQCLISIVSNQQGHRIMNIILNSPSRFNESKILSEWIFTSYNWI